MRAKLKNLKGQRICVRAAFVSFGPTKNKRLAALVYNVFLANTRDRLADHVWVQNAEVLSKLKLKKGDFIEFEATVQRYNKNKSAAKKTDYSLIDVSNGRRVCNT